MGNASVKILNGGFPGSPVAKTLQSQWGGRGSIPAQGTSSHMLQLWTHMLQLKTLHAQPIPSGAKKKKKKISYG